jgi:hypothetical protein
MSHRYCDELVVAQLENYQIIDSTNYFARMFHTTLLKIEPQNLSKLGFHVTLKVLIEMEVRLSEFKLNATKNLKESRCFVFDLLKTSFLRTLLPLLE